MGGIARSGGVRVATLAREEPRPLPGIRLPPPRAGDSAPLPSGGREPGKPVAGAWRQPASRRRDRVLDQALANLLREAKSTHDDIVKRIPARLHRLDQAVRRHGDPDLARARLQDGARAYLRNVDGPTLQALRRFDGGNADFYHMRGRGTDGARLGRERELGNLVAEEALLRSCELALAGALARETPGRSPGAWRRCWTRFPCAGWCPPAMRNGSASGMARRARCSAGRGISMRRSSKTLAMPSSQDTSLRRLAGALTGRLDADARERLGNWRARCPPTRTRLGRHRMRACARGGCCSRCWPTPREILPSVLSRQYPTRNPTPTLAVATRRPLPDAPRGFQPDFCTTDLSESASCW